MPTPVVTVTPNMMASPIGGTPASPMANRGLAALANAQGPFAFQNLLSMIGLEAQNANTAALQNPALVASSDPGATSTDAQLLFLSPKLANLSKDDLQSLLASLTGTNSSDIDQQILASLTPGVPAKDVLENLKAKFSELGIDVSKLAIASVNIPAAENQISVDGTEAQNPDNLLLIATGLNLSDIDALKAALKSASLKDTASENAIKNANDASAIAQKSIDATEASQAIILMVFAVPAQPTQTANVANDLSIPAASTDPIDISTMSVFTQPQDNTLEDSDWTKKLATKLSTLNDSESPFDDEMNEILSFNDSFKKPDVGFQGSIASTETAKAKVKSSSAEKIISGDMTAQTAQSLNNFAAIMNSGNGLPHEQLYLSTGAMSATQTTSQLINPVLNATSAASAHPTVQAVATMIEKAASGSDKAKKELSVELDPPELGRLQIQLSMEKDGPMKVHLIAEKQDTYNLLQRDSHALKAALDSAGVQMDGSSLTFDFSNGDQSFNQMMSGSNDQQSRGQNETRFTISSSGTIQNTSDLEPLDTKLNFIPDTISGNVHYSFLA